MWIKSPTRNKGRQFNANVATKNCFALPASKLFWECSENLVSELSTQFLYSVLTLKGGQFSKELWSCVGGEVKHKTLDLSTELKR